jgi:hypothetical protein
MAVNKSLNETSSTHEDSSMPGVLPDIDAKISELAYYKAERRGFAPGHEMEDWLEAERELADIMR